MNVLQNQLSVLNLEQIAMNVLTFLQWNLVPHKASDRLVVNGKV